MRLTTGGKVGNFFRRIGKGIKTGAKWLYNKGKTVVNKVVDTAPKVLNTAKTVLGILPSNKYTDAAKNIVNKTDAAYKKGQEIAQRGKAAYEAGKRAFSGGGS